ncbi:hypothetical protein [Thiomonas sp.]
MFALIIALIATILVVGLVIAGIYYGGPIFSDNEATAQAAAYQAQGNQLAGAILLYENANAGALPPSLSTLTQEGYLTVVPPGGWAVNGDYVTQDGVSQASCQAADTAVGISAVPACSAATPTTPCCTQ